MKNFMTILMIILSSFIPFVVFAQTNFVRDLFVGISGSDVLDLQKILNSDSETKIAETGVGSAGSETDYFGNLTKSAVEKFQIKYSEYVLKPIGLALPTGYVGQYTRDFLNTKFLELKNENEKDNLSEENIENEKNKNSVTKTPQTNTPKNFFNVTKKEVELVKNNLGAIFEKIKDINITETDLEKYKNLIPDLPYFSNKVTVYNSDPYQVAPGQEITINGLGFTQEENEFSFDNFLVKKVNCESSVACTFTLPKNIPLGDKKINLKNSKGTSKGQSFEAKVKITDNPTAPTNLISISPSEIKADGQNLKITISGEGFGKTNYIYSPMGTSGPVDSSNGKVSFYLNDLKEKEKLFNAINTQKAKGVSIPFAVSNEHGLSNYVNITFKN